MAAHAHTAPPRPLLSQRVAALNAALPSRAECLLPCWVPRPALTGLLRRCVRDDAACERQRRGRLPAAAAGAAGRQPTYSSHAECCRAGLGAYADGCDIPW